MPPKKKMTPAPIDRPLSRAYLRQFTGWSTEYPPGLSDPASLRTMENVMVNRDGSVRVRPGLRYLSYTIPPLDGGTGTKIDKEIIGTHEAFYLNDGTKAYLFAVRESSGNIGFRVLRLNVSGSTVMMLTDPLVAFDIPQGEVNVQFTSATTYVKYVQIDNKIFALSDAGEEMRLFNVGAAKSVRKLNSLSRPEWTVDDKLTVVHPDASWINTGIISSLRVNLMTEPSFEAALGFFSWSATVGRCARVSSGPTVQGAYSLRLESQPQQTNLCPNPISTASIAGWVGVFTTISLSGGRLHAAMPSGTTAGLALSPLCAVTAGEAYTPSMNFDTAGSGGLSTFDIYISWCDSSGSSIGSSTIASGAATSGRKVGNAATAPSGAVYARIAIQCTKSSSGATSAFEAYWARLSRSTEPTTYMDGNSGTNYLWTGTADLSPSVYHPPADVTVTAPWVQVSGRSSGCASVHARSSATARAVTVSQTFYDSSSVVVGTDTGAPINDSSGSWVRPYSTVAVPAGAVLSVMNVTVTAVPRGEYHYIDGVMWDNNATTPGTYFDGSTPPPTSDYTYAWTGTAHQSTSTEFVYITGITLPPPESKTADTLISSISEDNQYNFGFFYTFGNEVGESSASQITAVRTKRGWSAWRWETANMVGEPSGTPTDNPTLSADQLAAYMPEGVFDVAIAEGATEWNLYMFTWSDQDPIPVTAVKVASRELSPTASYDTSWIRLTPVVNEQYNDVTTLPNAGNRYNYSSPSRAGQGLVAADRLVLVNDPTAQAVIRWSSNNQGDYTNFTASKGGGYKTLTSGNLFIPACVKLWQNPQSADTLTILCMGTDGHSTGYYMAPAQVASQSEAVNIMGFEETTATPGTTSPYGCEVFNNSLYHPLDDQLMKSTASNYNINHKSQSDLIRSNWERLSNKQNIISSVHDNRLYYVVQNPDGAELEDGCNGNEIWVLDAGSDKGTWSRLLIQAHSLRKIEFGGRLFMSVVRPDGIFYLDPSYDRDDVVVVETGELTTAPIAWSMETNTQGANRAHDAWAHLQQLSVNLGNFQGEMRYGLRGFDLHGKPIVVTKVVRDTNPGSSRPFDLEDFLQIRRDMKEWRFFAESTGELCYGQINLVQYRYTPSTVNTGYEFGSVETFEYSRDAVGADTSATFNGIPVPMIDTGRP